MKVFSYNKRVIIVGILLLPIVVISEIYNLLFYLKYIGLEGIGVFAYIFTFIILATSTLLFRIFNDIDDIKKKNNSKESFESERDKKIRQIKSLVESSTTYATSFGLLGTVIGMSNALQKIINVKKSDDIFKIMADSGMFMSLKTTIIGFLILIIVNAIADYYISKLLFLEKKYE